MKEIRSKFAPPLDIQELSPYVGKAGEHLVLAELLLRKFDAALVEVDTGTDILAEKEGRLLRIQVKTRRIGNDEKTSFIVSRKALLHKAFPDYFVVLLVDFKKWKTESLVFPKDVLFDFVKTGLLRQQKKQDRYYGTLIRKGESWFLANLQHDISKYRNAFDVVR